MIANRLFPHHGMDKADQSHQRQKIHNRLENILVPEQDFRPSSYQKERTQSGKMPSGITYLRIQRRHK